MSCKIALTVLTEIASMARAVATMAGLVRIVTSRLAPTRTLDMGNAVKAIACVMRGGLVTTAPCSPAPMLAPITELATRKIICVIASAVFRGLIVARSLVPTLAQETEFAIGRAGPARALQVG